MSDLEVDTRELEATGSALRLLADELRDAQDIVHDGSRWLGHRTLAGSLDHMQGSWDDRRNDLRDAVDGFAGVVREAGQCFEEIERHLHAALTQDGS